MASPLGPPPQLRTYAFLGCRLCWLVEAANEDLSTLFATTKVQHLAKLTVFSCRASQYKLASAAHK